MECGMRRMQAVNVACASLTSQRPSPEMLRVVEEN